MLLPLGKAEAEGHHFWQRRFYDFNVWSQNKFVEKLQYMHMNPVKRKLVVHPQDCHGAVFPSTRKEIRGWSASIPRVDPGHKVHLKRPLHEPKTGAPEIPSQRPGHPLVFPVSRGTLRTGSQTLEDRKALSR